MKNALRYLPLVVALLLATGCAPHVYSPPGRVNHLESAATLEEGEDAVSAAAGVAGAVFGFSGIGLATSYRRGVSDNLQLGADLNLILVDTDEVADPPSSSIYGARLHSKWAPEAAGGHLAFTGGVGAGFSPDAGAYVSPDLGVIAAYENRYFVPFIGANAFVSQPFATSVLDLSKVDEAPGTRLKEAQTTWGWQGAVGFRIPIPVSGSLARVNLYSSALVMGLYDGEEHEVGAGFMGGPEFVF